LTCWEELRGGLLPGAVEGGNAAPLEEAPARAI